MADNKAYWLVVRWLIGIDNGVDRFDFFSRRCECRISGWIEQEGSDYGDDLEYFAYSQNKGYADGNCISDNYTSFVCRIDVSELINYFIVIAII